MVFSLGNNWTDEHKGMKAYLSHQEMQIGSNVDTTINYYYINTKGNKINCNALFLRDTGEVIVVNENGCQVALDKANLYIYK